MPPINSTGETYLDTYLTSYSLSWVQDESAFIAPRASTVIPVLLQSGKYVEYERGQFLRDEYKARPLGGRPPRATTSATPQSYSCEEWGLEESIDDRQRQNQQNPVNIELAKTRSLTGKALIKADRVWATSFFKAGVWTFGQTGVATGPAANQFIQFDQAGSDPLNVVEEEKDRIRLATGFEPNVLILGSDVKRSLRTQDDITDRIKHVGTGLATEAKLAELFEVTNLRTARSVYNAADEGEADDLQYMVNPKGMWLGYVEPEAALDAPTAIATFLWTGLVDGADPGGLGAVIERYREGPSHSDILQGRTAWGMQQVAADLGSYFENVVS